MTGYYLLRILSWLIYKMPWRVRYGLSDAFFVIIYYIVRYRRKVVNLNLANSFPEKTQKERDLIAKKFYRHICDSFIETLYFDHTSLTAGKNCVKFVNPELLNAVFKRSPS